MFILSLGESEWGEKVGKKGTSTVSPSLHRKKKTTRILTIVQHCFHSLTSALLAEHKEKEAKEGKEEEAS